MSRLNDLLIKFCPEGVPYFELGDIAEYGTARIDALKVDASSYVGVENLLPDKQGKTMSSFVPSEGRLVRFEDGDVLIGNIRPYLKKIWLADCLGGTNGDVLVIHITKDQVAPKYLYHCLSSDMFFYYDTKFSKGSKMPRGDKAIIMKYKIPVPPIEVQREIIKVLDNFTELTAELTAELMAELTARKKQYKCYSEQLLRLPQYPRE